MSIPEENKIVKKLTVRVSAISIIGNTVLSILKVLTGFLSHSSAMISDGVHSASDVFSSFIVIIGVMFSTKKADKDHPYGHERFECVAAIIMAGILLITAIFMGKTAVSELNANVNVPDVPGIAALVAAVISIISKESMYRYTCYYAKKLDSASLMADAWHHRSDALSSVGALIGIAGARMGFPALDKIAGLIICIFIIRAAYDIFKDAVSKMVDSSCSDEFEDKLRKCAEEQNGVLGIDLIQTRVFGNRIYVDIEISADGSISLFESHAIAENVHDAIEERFETVKHVMVHVNPK